MLEEHCTTEELPACLAVLKHAYAGQLPQGADLGLLRAKSECMHSLMSHLGFLSLVLEAKLSQMDSSLDMQRSTGYVSAAI